MSIDHVSLGVTDLARSKAFYDAVLKPLGIAPLYEYDGAVGYGAAPDRANFWIGSPFDSGRKVAAGGGTHVAFAAADRKAVDAFFAAALARGARDDGRPGPRPIYHADYYGAFVLDPDGHKIEACCHRPQ